MDIRIRAIKEADYLSAYGFQNEYLDQEDYPGFIRRVEADPDFYIGAFLQEELVGICYGEPSKKCPGAVCLQGIAVTLDEKKGLARRGIGSLMLQRFEEIARDKGYNKISLGSADDAKVEKFYLKNGFHPCELVAKGSAYEEYARMHVDSYETGLKLKTELYHKYNPNEVIIIFEKKL